jgi:hypothetical protein
VEGFVVMRIINHCPWVGNIVVAYIGQSMVPKVGR